MDNPTPEEPTVPAAGVEGADATWAEDTADTAVDVPAAEPESAPEESTSDDTPTQASDVPAQPWGPNWDPATSPIPLIRTTDPVAAAVGNASLLGVGYFLIRRAGWAFATLAITVLLAILLATAWRTTAFELVVVAWWLALIAHGWFLAGRRANRTTSRGQRIAAVAFAVPVLLVVGLLRWGGESIDGDLDDARAAGDCGQARPALDDIGWTDYVVDAPMTVHSEQTADACARLSTATHQLTDGLATGLPASLDNGFRTLRGVLADRPGHEHMVDAVLDGFLRGLPAPDVCTTTLITDWLHQLPVAHDRLDRVKDVLPKIEPAALLGCGDQLLAAKDWKTARWRYEQLIDRYPADPGIAKAKASNTKAGLGIEHDHVRDLLSSNQYCAKPAKYSAAPAYKKGTNRGYFLGDDTYVGDLPGGWKTTDFGKAALMVCLGDARSGPVVRTCPYTYEGGIGVVSVAFHKIAIPVKAYSLRTGKKVVDTTIQISGSACPASFLYSTYIAGPPGDQDVKPTKAGVQLAFKFLVVR